MRTFLLIIVVLAQGTHGLCAERAYDPNVAKWSVVTPPPKADREAWRAFWGFTTDYKAQMRIWRQMWVVRREKGKVLACIESDLPKSDESLGFDTTVELHQAKVRASVFTKVDDGWITGYDRGEFGAAVYWFNETGTQKYRISHHHIHGFLLDGKRLFAVQGLNHLMSRGSMVELRKERGQWVCREFLPLPGCGEAIAKIAPGDYAVVTSSMLLRINLKKEVKILVPKADPWLGASSMILADEGFIYIGMRRFVARYKLGSDIQRVQYLVPERSWLNADEN